MNVEHISDAMELLDDDIIDEANALRGSMRRSGAGLSPTICPGCP